MTLDPFLVGFLFLLVAFGLGIARQWWEKKLWRREEEWLLARLQELRQWRNELLDILSRVDADLVAAVDEVESRMDDD